MGKKTNVLGIDDRMLEKVRELLFEEGNASAMLLDDRQLAEISAAALDSAREAAVVEAQRKAAEIAAGIVAREADGLVERLVRSIESGAASDAASLKSALATGQGTLADRVAEAVIAKVSPRLFGRRMVDNLPPCPSGHVRVRIPEGTTAEQVYDMMPDGFKKRIVADNGGGRVVCGSSECSFAFERGSADLSCGVIDFFTSHINEDTNGRLATPNLTQVYLAFVPGKTRESCQISQTRYKRNVRLPSYEDALFQDETVEIYRSFMTYSRTSQDSVLHYCPHFPSFS